VLFPVIIRFEAGRKSCCSRLAVSYFLAFRFRIVVLFAVVCSIRAVSVKSGVSVMALDGFWSEISCQVLTCVCRLGERRGLYGVFWVVVKRFSLERRLFFDDSRRWNPSASTLRIGVVCWIQVQFPMIGWNVVWCI